MSDILFNPLKAGALASFRLIMKDGLQVIKQEAENTQSIN